MNLGVFIKPDNRDVENFEIPTSIGRIVFRVKDQNPNGETSSWYDSVACSDLFGNTNISYGVFASLGVELGYCVDPKLAYVQGLGLYGHQKYI